MDDIDRAQERDQLLRDIALIEANHHRPPPTPPIGRCYNCESSVPPGVRFCDLDCRDDYDARKRAEARRG